MSEGSLGRELVASERFFTARYPKGLAPGARIDEIGACINGIIDASEHTTFVVFSTAKDIFRNIDAASRTGFTVTSDLSRRWEREGCTVSLHHEDGTNPPQEYPKDACVIIDIRDDFPTLAFFLDHLSKLCCSKDVRLIAEEEEEAEVK